MKKTTVVIFVLIVVALLVYMFYPKGMMEETGISGEETMISYIDVSAEQAKQLIDENPDLIVIDVSPHYAEGHLPRAISLYPSEVLQNAIPTLDPDKTYLVYCHADGPSRAGAQALIDAGFENVYRLESHFSGWQSAGYEIEI